MYAAPVFFAPLSWPNAPTTSPTESPTKKPTHSPTTS
eukprot:CAMPEP_0203745600 /NCGR_PEP_ID=MMETSP0098-20131031/1278_1 /ASSEMBLY_ACC=CAM_ASM_000208 /TAXON_ID=96639 /ORGANISM=" , Strain NY0313808BC1" /LENGTH=36 /DNA_ID= /DNA_START= /DNA_END= /DNA_ORIENTATION=